MITKYSATKNFVHSLKLRDKFGRYLWRTFMNHVVMSHMLLIVKYYLQNWIEITDKYVVELSGVFLI